MLAALMAFNNQLLKAKETGVYGTAAWDEALRSLVLMIAPITPHVAEELWEHLGGAYSVHDQPWPVSDPALAADEVITLVVQVNGKVRARIDVPAAVSEDEAWATALAHENVGRFIEDKRILKRIYVPGRLLNLVVR
jgi:leucyl-tRNA synthetase